MKKFVSLISALAMLVCLCIPAFAAEEAKFAVVIVSESDASAEVSIDYNGGAAFSCLDFEVKLSNRLSVEKCVNGAGLRNFAIYANDTAGGANTQVITSFNKDINPVKFTFAALVDFKAVNGKDLLVLTLNKKTAGKLTADDVNLKITNCGISEENPMNIIQLKTAVQQIGGKTNEAPATAPGQAGTTVTKTTSAAEQTASTQQVSENSSENISSKQNEKSDETEQNTDVQAKKLDKKKIIIVAAAALAMVLIIAAVIVYVVKKTKNEDVE